MKHLQLFFILIFFFFNLFIFSSNANAFNLDDLSKYSEIKGYCRVKNINNIPLSVKIEQMLFLNWNFNKINYSELLDYLKNHHIGGISLSVNNLENNKCNLKKFIISMKNLYTLPNFHTIPYFININSNDLLNSTNEFKDYKNINIIHYLGANIININTEVHPYINNLENYSMLINYLKYSNKKGIIVVLNKFKEPFDNNKQINIYGQLIKKDKFEQIIAPKNYSVPEVDKNHYYSLSKTALSEDIKTKLRFQGILLNTSLDSQKIKNKFTINQIIINSITSGNNMLYYNGETLEDNKKFVEQVVNIVSTAINAGIISVDDINKSYIKIINLKTQFCIIPRENYC